MGLGILEHLEGRPTPWGLTKSYDSQCETNSVVKRLMENQSCIFVQTDDDISLWPRIISRNPPNCNLQPHLWSGRVAQDLFLIGTPDCCTWDFPACRFKPECWSAQFGGVCVAVVIAV